MSPGTRRGADSDRVSPSANTATAKSQVPADGDTANRRPPAPRLTSEERRLRLAVLTGLRWSTFAIGEAPGISYADSSSAWQIETLAHLFAAGTGSWGSAYTVEAAG